MAAREIIPKLVRFLKREDGPTAVEYAVMLALILVVALNGITMLGDSTGGSFAKSNGAIGAAFRD